MNKWQLPEGIDELAGSQAASFEVIRRRLLDLYQSWGYELVVPPMVEYVESLILTSDSVDQKTFKFLDPCSGRMLGVHADITPQIARIDSKISEDGSVNRYCYINAILQTKADDFYTSRSPIQAGAELYGFKGIDADIEVIGMMISSLAILDIEGLTLSLGDTSIFGALTEAADLDVEITASLRDIFKRKSIPDLSVFLDQNDILEAERFKALISLEGGADVLDRAKQLFEDLPQALEAIDSLIKLNEAFIDREVDLMFDLGEIKAYEYHNGVVFAAYHADFSKALAQGGRYNGLSQSFGVARDATGFSLDLKFLIQQQSDSKFSPKILSAPNTNDESLKAFVKELRSSGVVVKQDIENSNNANIVKSGNEWIIKD